MATTASVVDLVLAQTPEIDVQGLDDAIDTGGLHWSDWAIAGGVLVASVVLGSIVSRLIKRALARRDAEGFMVDLTARAAGTAVFVAGFVYALARLGVRIGPLLGALGILGITYGVMHFTVAVAVAFALKDTLENLISGIIFQVRGPFKKGDEIAVGGLGDERQGRVVEVNSRSVVIDTPDGERLFVPSASLISEPIVNLTRFSRRRTTLVVEVAYGTDLRRVDQVLRPAVQAIDGVLDQPACDVRITTFAASGVEVAVRFWHTPRIAEMWRVRDEVAKTVSQALTDAGIAIPFPQTVVHFADGAGPAPLADAGRPARG